MTELSTAEAFGMWILTGTLERFPDLKLVFVEPGLGWVPWWLDLVDDQVQRQGYRFPDIKELPSFYFHRNIWLTYIYEPESIRLLRHRIGVDRILWSTDYPHPITSWPESRQLAAQSFQGVPVKERQAILCGNAAKVWRL
jgi:predicted TIM-barrel fold metal-dependent hydrolase